MKSRLITKPRQWMMAVLVTLVSVSPPAIAQFKSPGAVDQRIKLNAVGDAECQMNLKLPADAYTQLKGENINHAAFLRRLGWDHVASEIENATAAFDDSASTIRIQWKSRGYASFRNNRWEAPITEVARGYLTLNRTNLWERPLPPASRIELLRVYGKEVLLSEAVSHTVTDEILPRHPQANMPSAASAITQMEFPSEVSGVAIHSDPPRLVYHLNPETITSADCHSETPCSESLEIQINVQPRLMSNIAKSYGTQRASTFWVARVVAKNTGAGPLKDYKVRIRLSHGAQDWTPWHRSDQLLPNQTVVDAFHPLLDPHSLAKNQSTQRSHVYIEYSYRDRSGKEVTEQVVRNIEILSRNEVVWSSFTNDQIVDFQDQFNNAPLVLASMATKDDPVVQMVAGRVSEIAGKAPPTDDDDQVSMNFLHALHTFIATNRIAYQT
ncbi:MAG: hypothetical protein KDA85_19685, partial [Planctomycetaceae bacterium]|nr:hypothetical protein [Planctomycetaceae bacterium]